MTFLVLPQTKDAKDVSIANLPPKLQSDPKSNSNRRNNSTEDCISKLVYFSLGFVLAFALATLFSFDNVFTQQDIFEIYQINESGQYYCVASQSDKANYQPEQLHISLGKASRKEILIHWATMEPVVHSHLFIKSLNMDTNEQDIIQATKYETVVYENVGSRLKNRTLVGYFVVVDMLEDEIYEYHIQNTVEHSKNCPSRQIFLSNTYRFKNPWYAIKQGFTEDNPLRVALYGDLGLINGQSTKRLVSDIDKDMYHAIIHNGDFGYDLNDHLGSLGDQFMRSIEPIAARVVYQTSVGNHEVAQNFTHYSHRFQMTDTSAGTRNNSFYYSFNLGPVHFVAYSTEFYYFMRQTGIEPLIAQYNWLKKDLRRANKPGERSKRPWIIVFGHRPMYCSSRLDDDCSKDYNLIRDGLPISGQYSLEKLFYEQGVDMVVEAHEHSYERFLPLYQGKIMNGTDDVRDPYHNPKAPVHVITGSAGCKENLDPSVKKPAPGSIVRVSDYGYMRLYASNSKLLIEQVSDDLDGHIVDKYTVSKSQMRNFPTRSSLKSFADKL